MKRYIAILMMIGGALAGQPSVQSDVPAKIIAMRDAAAEDRFERVNALWEALTRELEAQAGAKTGREPDRAAAAILARRRDDIRNGATAGAAGSTSTALNPLLPAAFGFALEDGSAIRTISGSTATISINPAGILCAARVDAVSVSQRQPGCHDDWRKLGVTLSFDNTRGEAPDGAGVKPLADQFAQTSIRYEVVNQRKPGTKRFQGAVDQWKATAATLANAANQLEILLDPLRRDLQTRILTELESPAFTQLTPDQKRDRLSAIVEDTRRRLPTDSAIVRQADAAWLDTIRASNAIYNNFAHGWAMTAEYTFQRPDVAAEAIGTIVPKDTRPPSMHTARWIVARGFTNYNIDMTLNVSGTWFDERLPGMTGYWRDAQVAADAKIRLRDFQDFGAPILTLAGMWMYLNQRPLGIDIPTMAGVNVNQPGSIGLFQAKLEIPTANAALRIPLSFTYSNRSDLIKESDVRGQIGISLNLDSFFAEPARQ